MKAGPAALGALAESRAIVGPAERATPARWPKTSPETAATPTSAHAPTAATRAAVRTAEDLRPSTSRTSAPRDAEASFTRSSSVSEDPRVAPDDGGAGAIARTTGAMPGTLVPCREARVTRPHAFERVPVRRAPRCAFGEDFVEVLSGARRLRFREKCW